MYTAAVKYHTVTCGDYTQNTHMIQNYKYCFIKIDLNINI